VIAPARTGRLVIRRIAVITTDHKKRGKRSIEIILVVREQIIVVKKLILPKIEETPAKCKLKITKSTETPLWYFESARGG
jgi:hypothetical protein